MAAEDSDGDAEAWSFLMRGNDFYKSASWAAAAREYTKGISRLVGKATDGASHIQKNKSDRDRDRDRLLALLYSNRCAAMLMSDDGERALQDARSALKLDAKRSKFHGRVGAALILLERYKEAIAAYELGLSIPGGQQHRGLLEGLAVSRRTLFETSRKSSEAQHPGGALKDSSLVSSEVKSDASAMDSSDDKPSHDFDGTNGDNRKRKRDNWDTADKPLKSASERAETHDEVDVGAFVAEVSEIGSTVKKTARAVDDSCLKTPSEEVQRILCKNHFWVNLNPFEVLQLLPLEATQEDIKQRYRALCALVHPDKCQLDGAQRAFEYVNAAYRALTDETRKKVIMGLIQASFEKADGELRKEKKMSSSALTASSATPSEASHFMQLLEQKRRKFTMITFAEAEEARRRAEKNQQAYRKRESDKLAEDKQKLKDSHDAEKAWQRGVDNRVSDWQDFAGIKRNIRKKRL